MIASNQSFTNSVFQMQFKLKCKGKIKENQNKNQKRLSNLF